ncbi:competence protein CoiA family protein [Variovorax ureilyticus]|uniref:Competence protein CoiA family protein n=1 Tax=Variovorax ureilyticus TaxID=1836198 RepID=A0ABU8VL24_9BURK
MSRDILPSTMPACNRRSDNLKMLARDAGCHHAPFTCPAYLAELIMRKGSIRIHHFAHKAPTSCRLGFREMQAHFQVKLAIFDGPRNQASVTHLELEKRLPGAVPDIYAVILGVPVAIEVQRSVLGVEGIAARTLNYRRLGIAVIWGALSNGDLDFERYSPSAWERWCHAANFGASTTGHGQVPSPVHFASSRCMWRIRLGASMERNTAPAATRSDPSFG